jgi:hypothetical protein
MALIKTFQSFFAIVPQGEFDPAVVVWTEQETLIVVVPTSGLPEPEQVLLIS